MTAPFVDPMFGKVYARELDLAGIYVAEHRGDINYLDAPAPTWSGPDRPPAGSGPVRGAATVDVETALTLTTEGSPAAPPEQPGRRSLTLEQHFESARIAYMVANHNHVAAERVRLDDLAHAQEWLS